MEKSEEEYFIESLERIDKIREDIRNGKPSELINDPEIKAILDRIEKEGEEYRAYLATLSPEEYEKEVERKKKEIIECGVRFIMNTDLGGD